MILITIISSLNLIFCPQTIQTKCFLEFAKPIPKKKKVLAIETQERLSEA